MPFIHDDFLLSNEPARRLYHDHAADQPIYDYHCHLSPEDLANNRRFDDLYEIWLAGDHYKWRAMRSNGVDERFCTGDASPYDKFLAYARTVPAALRNPLYHWTALELKRYFDIDTLLNEDTAPGIWEEANAKLKSMTSKDILDRFNVALIGTTDDPVDSLEHHRRIADEKPFDTVVYPAFRPDKAYALGDVNAWNGYVDQLAAASDTDCSTFYGLLDALRNRHAFFHRMGSRLSDHGLTHLPAVACTDSEAKAIFDLARAGGAASAEQRDKFTVYLMLEFGQMDAEAGWTKQLHLGPMRNNNGWALEHLGPDTGFDSIGDYPQGEGLSKYLGTLAAREHCPRTILYNINPSDNYLFATMVGNFQDGRVAGKIQFGSGWWFNDQLEGMTRQINALSNLGLLGRFVGMLTDSRSMLSYIRHEYFRRLLCELIGKDVEAGLLPNDMTMLGELVENICFHNAKRYFGMRLGAKYA